MFDVSVAAAGAARPLKVTIERSDEQLCLQAFLRGAPSGAYTCAMRGELVGLALSVSPGACRVSRGVVGGFTGPTVRRVELVLGSGRRLSRATRPVPRSGGLRSVVMVIGRGAAVRGARGLSAQRAVVARQRLGTPPKTAGCVGGAGYNDLQDANPPPRRPSTPGVIVAAAGGHELRVADSKRLLCVGLNGGRAPAFRRRRSRATSCLRAATGRSAACSPAR